MGADRRAVLVPRRTPLGDRTAAWILRVDEIWPGGPGLCAAWGVNALSTLAFCNLLRYRCPQFLDNRGLTMIELHPTKAPTRPSTYEWTRDWDYSVVMETLGELPESRGVARKPVLV